MRHIVTVAVYTAVAAAVLAVAATGFLGRDARAAGTITFVGIDVVTTGNTSTQINGHLVAAVVLATDVQTCISVANGATFNIDIVLHGLPADATPTTGGDRLAGVNYDIDYDGAIVKLGNNDDPGTDGLYDEDTLIGDTDQDGDGSDGEEGNDDPNSIGATTGHTPIMLSGANDFSKGNGVDTATWSDFHSSLFKLSGFIAGPRSGAIERITVKAVGAGVTTLNLRDDANAAPTLGDDASANFTIGNGGAGDATIAVDVPCPSGATATATATTTATATATATETAMATATETATATPTETATATPTETATAGPSPSPTFTPTPTPTPTPGPASGRTTSTQVSCNAPLLIGQGSTCTATVTDTAGGGASSPSGTVTFSSTVAGGFTPGVTCTLSPAASDSSSCAVTYTPTSVGGGNVSASYGGGGVHLGSSGTAAISVNLRTTSTSASCASPVNVNQGSACTVTVTDTAGGTASSPSGTMTLSSSGSGAFAPACTLSPSGSGVSTCSVTYTPSALGTGSHTITAGYPGSGVHGVSSGGTTVTVNPPADLRVIKNGLPNPVTVGSTLTYTVRVINNGPGPATGVTATDVLPGSVTFGSASPTQGTCSQASGTVTCSLGTIPSSAIVTVTILVTPTVAGVITNTASVTGNETDLVPSNNSTSLDTTVRAPCVRFDSITVLTPWPTPAGDEDCDGFATSVETSVGTGPQLACGVDAWPVDIDNDLSVTISDVLTILPAFNTTGPNPPYDARFDLNADNTVGLQDILIFIPFFNRTCSTILPTATPAPTATPTPTVTPTPSPTSTPAPTAVPLRPTSTAMNCGSLFVVDQGSTCTVTVTDTGGVGASSPSGTVTFGTSGSGAFTPGSSCSLSPASSNSSTCAVTYTPASAGSGSHTITGSYPGSGTHTASSGGTAVPVDLRTTSTTLACSSPVVVNQGSACTATVMDTAGVGASSPGGTVTFGTSGSGAFTPLASCTLSPLSSSSSSCAVTYTPASPGTGTHTITGSYAGGGVHHASSAAADILVVLRSTSTSVSCASPVNISQGSACTVTVTDTAGAGASSPGGTVSFTTSGFGTFSPAASCALSPAGSDSSSCPVTYTPSAYGTGSHMIGATYPAGSVHGGSSNSTTIIINPPVNLFVQKAASPNPVAVGSTLTYTITVNNFGPGSATGVSLTDVLPGGVTFASVSSSQGTCLQASGTVTCSLGGLASSGSATVTIMVTPTTSGPITNSATATLNEFDPAPSNNTASASVTARQPCIRFDSVTVLTPWQTPPGDEDCDGFTTAVENFVGTDPHLWCGVNAWPVDVTNDNRANLQDILAMIPAFNTVAPTPPYNARVDINADGRVGLQDILVIIPFFGLMCTP
ncbi:MAG: hypothetical protein Q7T33_15205 [Dehalococcoidia bacterium]|nr:hypothetical protein [Dehalococcoidia bacterium]